MNTEIKPGKARFGSEPQKYAAYLETPEGRLRLDLAFANLQEFLPAREKNSLRVLDVGCGTGTTASRLARLGLEVTLLDSSQGMLEIAKRAAEETGVADKVTIHLGDAAQLANLFPAQSFDLVLCHNTLEYVDDPGIVLRRAAVLMRDSVSILSLLVRNQAGEVFKAAIQAGDVTMAERNLTSEWAHESLYGGPVRLFKPDTVREHLKSAGLQAIVERGVRVMSDYLPVTVDRAAEYDRILELERKLGNLAEFSAIARYTHFVARRAGMGRR